MTDEVASELSPGIRGAVEFLGHHGYETSDSGDGSAYLDGMKCAFKDRWLAEHAKYMLRR